MLSIHRRKGDVPLGITWLTQRFKTGALLVGAALGMAGCQHPSPPPSTMSAHGPRTPAVEKGSIPPFEAEQTSPSARLVVEQSTPVTIPAKRGGAGSSEEDIGCVDCLQAHGKAPIS